MAGKQKIKQQPTGKVRITFSGLTLFVNQPLGTTVLMPEAAHAVNLVGPFNKKPINLATGTDLRIVRVVKQKKKQILRPLTPAPTLRASTELVVHLDHVYGQRTPAPRELTGPVVPAFVNARMTLTGGSLTALPATAYRGQLRNVYWQFEAAGGRTEPHQQKLTDTTEYNVLLEPGTYAIEVRGPQKSTSQVFPFKVTSRTTEISLVNDDDCPPRALPDYNPNEIQEVFALVGKAKPFPDVQGQPQGNVLPVSVPSSKPTGCACDPICPQLQVDGD